MKYSILFLFFLGVPTLISAQSDSSKEKNLQARRTIMMANVYEVNDALNKKIKSSLTETDKKNALDLASVEKTSLKTFSIFEDMEAYAGVRATIYILENSESIKRKKKQ